MLKAGLAVVPVVLSLRARPAWAQALPDWFSGAVSRLDGYGEPGFEDPNTGIINPSPAPEEEEGASLRDPFMSNSYRYNEDPNAPAENWTNEGW